MRTGDMMKKKNVILDFFRLQFTYQNEQIIRGMDQPFYDTNWTKLPSPAAHTVRLHSCCHTGVNAHTLTGGRKITLALLCICRYMCGK